MLVEFLEPDVVVETDDGDHDHIYVSKDEIVITRDDGSRETLER